MIFDEVRKLKNKKRITKLDMCRFLANVPDTTISVGLSPADIGMDETVEAISRMYSHEDLKELFWYWFGIYSYMEDGKKEAIWMED